ncbi:hypothetical protein ACFL1G_05820 [Planctomycetota bacterium]
MESTAVALKNLTMGQSAAAGTIGVAEVTGEAVNKEEKTSVRSLNCHYKYDNNYTNRQNNKRHA